MALPIVAVVGRPNVGKSTFVNRITQGEHAIVHEMRGVTRDRSYHTAEWNGVHFTLIDTGGIEVAKDDQFQASIRAQADVATSEADIIILLVDGKVGLTADDEEVARILRKSGKPVFLVVNKVDHPGSLNETYEFYSLGFAEVWPVSSTHGNGTGDLLDAIVAVLPEVEEEPEGYDEAINIAIIGRPNAGKSSLANRLSGTERSIVSDVAGTTRDAIDTLVESNGVRYRLIDTAGLRRKALIDEDVEYYGFVRAMRAIDRADVALLIIDSSIGLTDQDQRVANFAIERECAMVVILNKWDLLETQDERDALLTKIEERLGFIGWATVLRISALTGKNTHKIWDAVNRAYASYAEQIPTSALNRLLTELREFGHTVNQRGKTLRINYVTQTKTSPPEFTFFANHPEMVDSNFERYIENRVRERFQLEGTPIRIKFKRKS